MVIPTHEHPHLLAFSIRSALDQTVEDLEVLVVGDGADDGTRDVAQAAGASDPRVRFFDCRKGLRHGEANRHKALQTARGQIVCYLADDDLWMADHVAAMEELLQEADFAHTLPVVCDGDGRLSTLQVDLGLPYYRDLLLSGENRIPFSIAGHTMNAYSRLPRGWTPAPATTFTDLHFWNQFLAEDTFRARSGFRPTALHFPTPERTGWSTAQRTDELELWQARLREDGGEARIANQLLKKSHVALAHGEAELNDSLRNQKNPGGLEPQAEAAGADQVEQLQRRVGILETLNSQLQARLDSLLGAEGDDP